MRSQSEKMSMRVKITGACNLNCGFCHKEGGNNISNITLTQIDEICEFAKNHGFNQVHLTGGEPTRHKQLIEIVRKVVAHGLTCALTTNGQFPTTLLAQFKQAGLDRCNFSIHTVDPVEWSRIQGSRDDNQSRKQIDQVLANIEASQKLGLNTRINTVVGDDYSFAIGVVERLGNKGLDIRLLDNFESDISLANIDLLLNEIEAKPISEERSDSSNQYRLKYQTNFGPVTVKSIKLAKLETMCQNCQESCKEGFYTVRVEAIGDRLFARLCIKVENGLTLVPLTDFAESKQLTEIIFCDSKKEQTMNWESAVTAAINHYNRRLENTRQSAKDLVRAANESESRMESRFDTYREEYSFRAAATEAPIPDLEFARDFLDELTRSKRLKESNQVEIGSVARIKFNEEIRQILLVPTAGGDVLTSNNQECEDLRLISSIAPIGKCILGAHIGKILTLRTTKVIRIEILEIFNGGEE